MTGNHPVKRYLQKRCTEKKVPSICANKDCKLRKRGCKGFEGCPGYKGRNV